jgi:hypothetical protein
LSEAAKTIAIAKCVKKLMVLGAFALKVCKKYYYDPTKNFCNK